MDTMALSQWLQLIFLDRVRSIVAERGQFPPQSQVAAQAVREFDTVPNTFASVLSNLTAVEVLTESKTGIVETVGLDNFTLTTPTPEPSSAVAVAIHFWLGCPAPALPHSVAPPTASARPSARRTRDSAPRSGPVSHRRRARCARRTLPAS